jgi:hypothetical protein
MSNSSASKAAHGGSHKTMSDPDRTISELDQLFTLLKQHRVRAFEMGTIKITFDATAMLPEQTGLDEDDNEDVGNPLFAESEGN